MPSVKKGEGPVRRHRRVQALHEYLCIYKPGPVSRLRGTSTIYLGCASRRTSIDLPSGIGRAALILLSAELRYTWSFSPWGLPSSRCRHRDWWALTPPFHPYPPHGGRSPFLRHFPWRRRSQRHPFPLGSTVPYAARTFLPALCSTERWSDAQDANERSRQR